MSTLSRKKKTRSFRYLQRDIKEQLPKYEQSNRWND